MSAAGYASSAELYNFGDPPFIHDVYSIAPFQIPSTNGGFNGTVTVNTTAIKTETNCYSMTTQFTASSGGGFANNATFGNCSYSFSVGSAVGRYFGADVMPDCNNTGLLAYFRPVVFWFFNNDGTPPQTSATFCAPTISLFDVIATVDINTGNLTTVEEIQPFNASTSLFASLSQNITGAPLNGRAFNGIVFNLTGVNEFVVGRANATDMQLPASIIQAASKGSGGLSAAFQTNSFVGIATTVYGTYLRLFATTVYFLPDEEPILVNVQSFQRRLWLSNVIVHIQATVLVIVAVVGTLVQVLHRRSRQLLRLQHIPGTIAAALSIGDEANLIQLLKDQQEGDLLEALDDKLFRIDPRTMKIVVVEDGYENAAKPRQYLAS